MTSLPSIGSPVIIITAVDEQLNHKVVDRAVALGHGLADEWKDQMRLLVREVIDITPPGSTGIKGREAYNRGVSKIRADCFNMGFDPVEIKGSRKISHVPAGNVKGRKAIAITPVTVATKLNPKFADPGAFHALRVTRRHSGRATRGGAQAFYVEIHQYRGMQKRLFASIGKLAAAWIGLANRLALKVPAWIARHEAWGLAHTTFDANFDPSAGRLFIYAINHAPGTTDPQLIEDTQRRIEAAKGYRINAIVRGLEGRAKRILQAA